MARGPIGYDFEIEPLGNRALDARDRGARTEVPREVSSVRVLRLPEGTEVRSRALGAELLQAQAICLGEAHDVPAHHSAAVWLIQSLARAARGRGLKLGIGLESFQQPFQHALSAYQRGEIGEAELLRRTEYETRWGYPFVLYRATLERARDLGLSMIALNAPRELTRAVARRGVEDLGPRQAQPLAAFDFQDSEHRSDFEHRMLDHPGVNREGLERYYQAQVVWDETMAERAALWISERAPIRRMLLIAGQAHCQRSAIPSRIERRGAGRALAVVLTTREPTASEQLAFDYAVVVGVRQN